MSDNTGLKLIKQVIEYGSIIGVPLTSGILQGIVPEEVLEIGIPTLANSLKNIGQEYAERMLSPRENLRVGSVLILASAGIRERIKSGENLRDDGFFDQNTTGRSDAEEITESILLKSQREPQEKKIPYMAHLLVNTAFNSEINVDMGHQLIKASEELTYRQLCILRLAAQKRLARINLVLGDRKRAKFYLNKEFLNKAKTCTEFKLRDNDYADHRSSFGIPLLQILYECFGLYQKGYVNFGDRAIFSIAEIHPENIDSRGIGDELFKLMNLHLIPDEDLVPIVEILLNH